MLLTIQKSERSGIFHISGQKVGSPVETEDKLTIVFHRSKKLLTPSCCRFCSKAPTCVFCVIVSPCDEFSYLAISGNNFNP